MTLTDRIVATISDAYNERRNALADGQTDHVAVAVELVSLGLACCKRKFSTDSASVRVDAHVAAVIDIAWAMALRLRNERFLAASLDASVSAWELSLGGALQTQEDALADVARPTGAEWALNYLQYFELQLINAALSAVKALRNNSAMSAPLDDEDDEESSEASSCTLDSSSELEDEEGDEEDEEDDNEEEEDDGGDDGDDGDGGERCAIDAHPESDEEGWVVSDALFKKQRK